MTPEELHDFTVQTLMAEYSDTRAIVHRYEKKESNQADFYFVNTGRRPNFSLGISGNKKVNVMVICKEKLTNIISDIDSTWMVSEYKRTGAIPRVTFATATCMYKGRLCEKMKDSVCGGDFCFEYYSVSLIPDQENQQLDKQLTDVEITDKFAEAWRKLDASIIEPYLDKDFHYASEWVFDVMPSKAEYLDYFIAKLDSLKPVHDKMRFEVMRDHQTKQTGVLIVEEKRHTLLYLEIAGGRIIAARMQEKMGRLKTFDPRDELSMDHLEHMNCIMPAEDLFKYKLKPALEASELWRNPFTMVTTDNLYEEFASVMAFMYGKGDMKLMTLMVEKRNNQSLDFLSLYPVCKGVPVEVTVEKVIEWDDQVEATVLCSVEYFKFAFFATDYYCNCSKYKVGEKIYVDLAALGMNVTEGDTEALIEGQAALEWRKIMGEDPEYDQEGNVKTVKINTKNMVMCVQCNFKCRDEWRFQSPVSDVTSTSLMDVEFYKTMIYICESGSCFGDTDVIIPLYFRKELLPNLKKGDPVKGMIWIAGSVTGMHEQMKADAQENDILAKVGEDFETAMEKTRIRYNENLMTVLQQLDLIKIRKGYVLDIFCKGDNYKIMRQPYCHKENATDYCTSAVNKGGMIKKAYHYLFEDTPETDDSKLFAYDDKKLVTGALTWREAKLMPPILNYFEVPFTPEGIMQAFLLDNVMDFLNNIDIYRCPINFYLFNAELFLKKFSVEDVDDKHLSGILNFRRHEARHKLRSVDLETLKPKITIDGNKALLQYTFWNDWKGLVKVTTKVVKHRNTIKFINPQQKLLVNYNCNIII